MSVQVSRIRKLNLRIEKAQNDTKNASVLHRNFCLPKVNKKKYLEKGVKYKCFPVSLFMSSLTLRFKILAFFSNQARKIKLYNL